MTIDEDYLDNLLKSVLDNEPVPNVPRESADNITPPEEAALSENVEADFAMPEQEPMPEEELPALEEQSFIEEELIDLAEDFSEDELPDLEEPLPEEELPIFEDPFNEEELSDLAENEAPLPEEELPVFEEPFAEEEFPDLTENDVPMLEDELPALEEPLFTDELPALEEVLPEEELPVFEDPFTEEELPDLAENDVPMPEEELPAFEESLLEDELPALEAPMPEDELPAFEEPLLEDELPALEEPLFAEEPLPEDDLPPLEEPLFAEEELPDPGEPAADAENLPDFEASASEEPLLDYGDLPVLDEILADEALPVSLEDVDLSLGGMPELDELPSDGPGEDEPSLNDFDIDSMLSEIDANMELPEDAAEPDFDAGLFGGDDDILSMMDQAASLPEDEPGIGAQMEEMEIGDLLAGMDNDEDLSDIKDLLDKDDNNELVDDDMLSLLDGMTGYPGDGEDDSDVLALFNDADPVAESAPAPKGKQKKKKGKGGDAADDELALSPDDIDAQLGIKKKKGVLSRIFAALTESDDESDEIDVKIQSISAENLGILDELNAEDGKEQKKTKKDKKQAKEKKEKKPKPPKEKKPKKEKPAKEPEAPEKPAKRVSKKNVLLTFIFSISFLAVIIAFTLLIPDYMEREDARIAYQNEDYKDIFALLYAKNRDPSDEFMFQQAQVVMKMNRSMESYQIFLSLDKPVEALNALLMGISRYDDIQGENLYGAEMKVNAAYQTIINTLSSAYGISLDDARAILALEGESYTRRLYEITMGIDFSDFINEEEGENESQ